MSFWDNIKKFTQPYADDEYDEYEDEDELEEFEEENEPVRASRGNRRPNPFKLNIGDDEDSFEIDTTPAPAPSTPIGFSGKVVSGNKQEAATKLLIEKKIDPRCPCTFMRLHRDATVIIEQALADEIGYKG